MDRARGADQEALGAHSAVVTLPAAAELDDDDKLRRALLAMVEAIDARPSRGPVTERARVRWVSTLTTLLGLTRRSPSHRASSPRSTASGGATFRSRRPTYELYGGIFG